MIKLAQWCFFVGILGMIVSMLGLAFWGTTQQEELLVCEKERVILVRELMSITCEPHDP